MVAEIADHRKPLGVTLARLERSYRVRAELVGADDVHLILTTSRERAIKFLALFCANGSYANPTIELGSDSYNSSDVDKGMLP